MGATKQQFWQMKNQTKNKGEILLYGDIAAKNSWWSDDSVTPKQFTQDLKDLGNVDEIEVRINSAGGDVFAANAIYNLLKSHNASITTIVDGLCGSAATIIAIAGDTLKMPKNTFFMIHNPATGGYGEAKDLRKAADLLDKVKETIISHYQIKTSLTTEEISTMMDETTWLTADEALDKGFIDEIVDYEVEDVFASGDFVVFNSVKHDVKNLINFPLNQISNIQKPIQNIGGEEIVKNVEEFKSKYPELYNEVVQNAVTNERNRIKEIEDLAVPGTEKIINSAKYENGQSAAEVAMSILKAQKDSNSQRLDNIVKDAQQISNVTPGDVTNPSNDEFTSMLDKVMNNIGGVK